MSPRTVELHGHRGARALRPENTLPGFAHALELGVHAIELDVGLTADGTPVVNHDQELSPANLTDTAPAHSGDPSFPYVGKPIRHLTLAQLKTVDAGGTPIPTLAEACTLVRPSGVTLAVELKTDPTWPDDLVGNFTDTVAQVLGTTNVTARLLAFDWRVLAHARTHHPSFGRVALIERKTLVPDTPWLAGRFRGAPVAAATAIGATALSPEHTLTTPGLVEQAHDHGLPVAVWTVNAREDMSRFIKYGVDAIVTDRPDRLRQVMADHALPLPQPHRSPD